MLEYLEQSARDYPDKSAYVYKDSRITFREMRRCAQGLAQRIRKTGILHSPVGVLVHRGHNTAALFFAVLYSDNFYVPIDPDMPAEKIRAILDDADIRVMLGCEEFRGKLQTFGYTGAYFSPHDALPESCAVPAVQAQARGEDISCRFYDTYAQVLNTLHA